MRNSLRRLFITLIFISGFIIILIGIYNFFYYKELREIKSELKEIENVEIINIWGSDDVSLEEISARLKIKNKCEIVLGSLSKDVNQYPKTIRVSEIGGYSFTTFTCNGGLGIGPSINIGYEGEIGKIIGVKFNKPKDIVQNIDKILKVIENLKKSPELNYFSNGNSETYLLVKKMKKEDKDPIFILFDIEDEFEFAKKLKWKNKTCYN